MNFVKPTSIKLYAYLSGAWSDITADWVVDPIVAEWGMSSNDPLDLIARTGSMTFTLNNKTGKYSPLLAGAVVGWGQGTPIKLEIVFDNFTYRRWYGKVSATKIQGGTNTARRVNVTVLDWMDYAATFPLNSMTVQTNKRGDEAIAAIVAAMPIQPLGYAYNIGYNTFPAIFDTVTTNTKAYSEFSKIAFSEMGYVYLRKDRYLGEVLIFEDAFYRNGLSALTTYPKSSYDGYFLFMEDHWRLLQEDGYRLLLNESTIFYADNSMTEVEVVYGENLINQMNVTAYPKTVDTSVKVLYSLGSPMQIGRGQTTTFTAGYKDPSGGARVSAIDGTMVAPVATTDYLMNSKSDGTGTNLTANLTVVAVYTAGQIAYTLTNSSASIGYITKLQARGYGVYQYDPIKTTQASAASESIYGILPADIPQQYQQDVQFGAYVAQGILDENKAPHTILKSVSFHANRSSDLMQAFLNLDVGNLVHLKENQTGIDGYYYIQGIRSSIMLGGIIDFTWIVKQAFSLLCGLSMIAIEFSGGSAGAGGPDLINYGLLPAVDNLSTITVSAWIAPATSGGEWYVYTVGGNYDGERGWALYIDQDDKFLGFLQAGTPGAQRGEWRTDFGTLTMDAWNHVLITRDTTSPTNKPVMYINGVSKTVTERYAQVGATSDDSTVPMVIGNEIVRNPTLTLTPFRGQIADFRVYNRILTATEAALMVSETGTSITGATSLTTGLVFQVNCVRTTDLASYANLTLTAETKVQDNARRAVGTPAGAPVARLLP